MTAIAARKSEATLANAFEPASPISFFILSAFASEMYIMRRLIDTEIIVTSQP